MEGRAEGGNPIGSLRLWDISAPRVSSIRQRGVAMRCVCETEPPPIPSSSFPNRKTKWKGRAPRRSAGTEAAVGSCGPPAGCEVAFAGQVPAMTLKRRWRWRTGLGRIRSGLSAWRRRRQAHRALGHELGHGGFNLRRRARSPRWFECPGRGLGQRARPWRGRRRPSRFRSASAPRLRTSAPAGPSLRRWCCRGRSGL